MRPSSASALFAICISLCAASANAASGNTCSASSPAHRAALVELYTSEGCNSCPPADNWLGALDHARRTDTIVPLALHVDYWDNRAWKDRFAQAAFTTRQQQLTSAGSGHVVYTPEIFVGGKELRDWSSDASFESRIKQLNSETPLADIHIDGHPSAPGHIAFNASFTARKNLPDDAVAYAAVYENQLVSTVNGGENNGATLHHDRVVRQWIGPIRLTEGRAQLSGDYASDAMRFGVVAFVERGTNGEVLQVAELASCGG
ncbi:DUF1223 domain-containing protein [uncultured Caballeronia sp.]|jgi:hypothetical protein|uniref:DUF1223 domain-containing protein n=1 Tax=uncultured Caballeronia sp. TaxID=1827198 RepID=UPI001576FC8C